MKSISKYFSLVYIIFIIAIIGMGINYLNNLPMYAKEFIIGPVTVNKDSVKAPAEDLPLLKGKISAPVDVFKLATSTQEQVDKGKTIFQTTCASCHGAEGKGDGTIGAALNPKPRNFTSPDGWKNGSKLTQMYKTLQEGIPNTAMASFSTISPDERIAIIHYIQETFIKTFTKNTEEELKELDKTYSLLAGVKQPNQIPIKTASEKLITDNEAVTKKVNTLVLQTEKSTADTAAIFFKAVTNNLTKALTLLATEHSWETNENRLYSLIGANPVSNGFRGRAATLSQKEISMLYVYLKNLFAGYKG